MPRVPDGPTRRLVLEGLLSAGALAAVGCREEPLVPREPRTPATGPLAGGVYVGDRPFLDEGERPLETLAGKGLDGRRRLDLAQLVPDKLVSTADAFYVRSREPELPAEWPVEVTGLVATPLKLSAAELAAAATDQGVHLLECSGNGQGESFGLISATTWSGVPLLGLLERAGARREGTRVMTVGKDYSEPSPNGSKPGCSWIFSWEDLERAAPFLATGMGGGPLPLAHGAPVRMFMPGWYGCCSAKWLERVEVVEEGAASSAHMREFAARTGQEGTPELARDFKPARIDAAAMPVRVEDWRVGGERRFRVVGIVWGGERVPDTLEIRFGKKGKWVPVSDYTPRADVHTWGMWSHDWAPNGGGEFRIDLRVPDESIPSKRLKKGWYARKVEV